MTFVRKIAEGAAVGVVDTPENLAVIRYAGVAAAIWRRRPATSFQRWIDGLDVGALPEARLIVRPSSVRTAVRLVCARSGMPDGSERHRLEGDIAALADLFAALTNATWLRLRLDVVSDNACAKFHVDAVTLRLLCTYRGTGTQYGVATDGRVPDEIFTTPTGAPLLLRGTLWPGDPPSGVVHRSPPIEGTGETRLVLVLDPLSAADAANEVDPRDEVVRTLH